MGTKSLKLIRLSRWWREKDRRNPARRGQLRIPQPRQLIQTLIKKQRKVWGKRKRCTPAWLVSSTRSKTEILEMFLPQVRSRLTAPQRPTARPSPVTKHQYQLIHWFDVCSTGAFTCVRLQATTSPTNLKSEARGPAWWRVLVRRRKEDFTNR